MKPFKFFQGRPSRLYQYSDRIINNSLYGGFRLAELSDRVQQIVSDPNYVPASYISIPESNHDSHVINIVRRRMNLRLPWRGYEIHVFEPDGYPLLKIVSGINIGGMFHILYLTTINDNTEHHRVSVPLINLQRRG